MRTLACASMLAVILLWGCAQPQAAPQLLKLSTGPKDATYFLLGEELATVYNAALKEIRAETIPSGGGSANIEAVQAGTAQVGLAPADSSYVAYTQGTDATPHPYRHLRAIAVLFPNTVHLIVRKDSAIRTLAGLRGNRVGVGRPGQFVSSSELRVGREIGPTLAAVFEASSSRHEASGTRERRLALDDVMPLLGRGEIEVGYLVGGPPFRPVTQAADAYGVRFLDIDDNALSRIRARHPFFKRAIIPAGTYKGQPTNVQAIAIDNLLICRDDLPTELVYRLTRAFYEGLPALAARHASAQYINPDNGVATPIPLHEGAARYYRERELLR